MPIDPWTHSPYPNSPPLPNPANRFQLPTLTFVICHGFLRFLGRYSFKILSKVWPKPDKESKVVELEPEWLSRSLVIFAGAREGILRTGTGSKP